jgi:hypothetical protein
VNKKAMYVFPIFNKYIYGLFDLPEKQKVYYCNLTQNASVKPVINTSTIYIKKHLVSYTVMNENYIVHREKYR